VDQLTGRVALVTGAGRGFGREIALAFARQGADVAVNYRASEEGAAEVARAIAQQGRRAWTVRADVAREEQVRAMMAGVLREFGRLDILVNNAGIMVRGPFAETAVDEYAGMFDVNVRGTMLCARHALPAMLERRHGRIINLSSQLAQRGVGGGFTAYATTKGAIEAFTRALAQEVGAHGVTVNAIAPGGIETDMSRQVMTPEYRRRRLAELPLQRFGDVEDVAYCAVVLASDAAGYLTGQILHPSGGWAGPARSPPAPAVKIDVTVVPA
jgi:3-oxoacyl-[acyl-carrier protein] reductase